MIGSQKKYIDPSEVVKSICDDFGNTLPIGDQKDVGEFNHYFLSRVEEGLSLSQEERMNEELNEEDKIQLEGQFKSRHSLIKETSIISKLFFGKFRCRMEFQQQGQLQEKERIELFNLISVDVKKRNLYDGWESQLIEDIDEYKNDLDETVKAQKYNWILDPPQSLYFQIQRVEYNKEFQQLTKINDDFKFDKELYADRFLYQNKDQFLKLRKQVAQYKNRQRELEQSINQLQNYNGTLNLNEGINNLVHFLDSQSTKSEQSSYFGAKSDLDKCIKVLKSYNNEIETRLKKLNEEYQNLEKQIEQTYNCFKNHKYILQSILIHDGNANSGHYYSYIYDQNQWKKFNDLHISNASEVDVFQEAYGKGNINAYLLIYQKEEFIKQQENKMIPLRTYSLYKDDMYKSYLSAQQLKNINIENELFEQEIRDFEASRKVDQIIEQYSKRFEYVNEQARLLKLKYEKVAFKPNFLINSGVLMKTQVNNDKNVENALKFLLLDSCLYDFHPSKINCLNENENQQFFQILKNKMKSSLSDYKSPSFPLTNQETNCIQTFQQQYINSLLLSANTIYFFNKVLEKQYISALQGLYQLINLVISLQQQKYVQTYYYRLSINMKRLITFASLFYIESNQQLENNQITDLLGVVIQFLNQQFFQDKDPQLFKVQITVLLSDIQTVHYNNQNINSFINTIQQQFENDVMVEQYEKILKSKPQELIDLEQLYLKEYPFLEINIDRKNDELLSCMIELFNKIKSQYNNCIQFDEKLKKAQIPIMKNER